MKALLCELAFAILLMNILDGWQPYPATLDYCLSSREIHVFMVFI